MRADAELPLVIPHPRAMRRVGNESIVLGEHGRVVAQIVLAERRSFFVQAENPIESALSKMGFADKSDSTLTTVVITERARLETEKSGVQPKALALTPADTLGSLYRCIQRYFDRKTDSRRIARRRRPG
jgi:hypothetical protein